MSLTLYRLRRLGLAIILLGTLPVAWAIRPWVIQGSISPCFFFTLTGRQCVFCGLTRAFAHATHGDWAQAFHCHPLWWVAALILLVLGSISLSDAVSGNDHLGICLRSKFATGWGTIAALVAASLWRAFA